MLACSEDPESPGAKSENSALLAVELQHKSEPISHIEFIDLDEYHFVCIPSHGHRIWIMLNPRHTPFYKQWPDENFSISKADYKKVEDKRIAADTVLQVLRSHLTEAAGE